MSIVQIAAIVEGHSECEAVPILIRRIALTIDPGFEPYVLPPIRVPASRLIKTGELERSVELAARKLRGKGGILVLLDCDWKQCCPAHEAPALLNRARIARPDMRLVILVKQEYEAWFLAAAESLRDKGGLPQYLQAPIEPEKIRAAKEWLSRHMPRGRSYAETVDQAAFTSQFDLEMARQRSDSFDKCYRDVRAMLEILHQRLMT